MVRLWALVLLGLLLNPSNALGDAYMPLASHWSVGYRALTFVDPVDDQPMHALAFYPSNSVGKRIQIGDFTIDANEDSRIAMGRFPLLVVSHGNYGNPLVLHDFTDAMVRQGFIVVTVLHPGDNFLDHRRTGALSNLYGRPLQISQAITAALQDSLLAPYIDGQRVGVVGYSAGGETALILAGAKPDLQRLRKYCLERPNDLDACTQKGELRADRPDLQAKADPRVRSLMLMAPLGLMFGRQALADVHVPVLLYSGGNDQLLAVEKNAAALARKLPITPDYRVLEGAGHFVFLAPCDAQQIIASPGMCLDAPGVDRVKIHREMDGQAGRFFTETLGVSLSSGLQTASHD